MACINVTYNVLLESHLTVYSLQWVSSNKNLLTISDLKSQLIPYDTYDKPFAQIKFEKGRFQKLFWWRYCLPAACVQLLPKWQCTSSSLSLPISHSSFHWEGVIPSRAKIRLGRLGHINVSHTFVTFLILWIFLAFSSPNIAPLVLMG